MLAGLFWNKWSFFLLFSVIHFGCWNEYLKLIEKIHNTSFHLYSRLGLMMAGYGIMLWFCGAYYQIDSYGLKENFSLPVSGAGFILLVSGIFRQQKIHVRAFGLAATGLLYISLCWGLMMDLWSIDPIHMSSACNTDGSFRNVAAVMPSVIIGTIWTNDTMAYIVGSLIGKTPFSKISPKKTWEGTIGGLVLAILLTGLLSVAVFRFTCAAEWIHWFIVPAIASIAGTAGDLLESRLKRMAGVKDSGTLMPGHGGFLDRFDSLLLAIPAVWLYVRVVLQ